MSFLLSLISSFTFHSALYILHFALNSSSINRGQVILRHTDSPAYRCFLPDLAGFTRFCRTGPSPFSSEWIYENVNCNRQNQNIRIDCIQNFALCLSSHGGEGGIRTHGTVAGTRDFQSRRFGHSRTSPQSLDDMVVSSCS